MNTPDNCLLVIFGASGDLTRRKLVPGLFNLYRRKLLPEGFAVLGTGRTPLDDDTFRARMDEGMQAFDEDYDPAIAAEFIKCLHYQPLDTAKAEDFAALRERVSAIHGAHGTDGNVVFYMSTPPSLFAPIVRHLDGEDLQKEHVDGAGWRRLIVEKPFGYDLESALQLNTDLHEVFDEHQIYRIDHYLGKETVQNMLVFRFGNGIFEPLWNRNWIERVEITAAESIGVGGRGGYYDGSGALRDMLQNHLLHIVGMLAMEPPSRFDADAVRNETIKVFEALRPISEDAVEANVVRGQYTASHVKGEAQPGYRDEDGVPDDSKTETYVAARVFIDTWRWGGVPFCIRTGKAMPTRVTEAVIHFKQAPHHLFAGATSTPIESSQLVLRIQPDEGIQMRFNMKLPGSGFEMKSVTMNFHYSDLSNVYVPEAYERLLLDCMLGDATLYARGDAVEACWRFLDPILNAWAAPGAKIFGYPYGTWGPHEAHKLLGDAGADWRYPCKNMADDGEYCEL